MTSISTETIRPPETNNQTRFENHDAAVESLGKTIALLRSWAAAPQMFDHISANDRESLFLLSLELAESAQARLLTLR